MKRPRLLAFALPLAGIVILLLSLLVGGASLHADQFARIASFG